MAGMNIPEDVSEYIRGIFADCNKRVSNKLTRIPNIHETSLDHSFIEYFTHHCRPVKSQSDWLIRFDCHFIGGGRHWGRWEVADFGIMVVFRHKGKIVRTKVTLLQSKRLYPREHQDETNPLDVDLGFNFLFMNEERWHALSDERTFTFEDKSLYRALEIDDDQYKAIEKYEERHQVPVHYMFYNPCDVPHSVTFPITGGGEKLGACPVGCRIVPSEALREMVKLRTIERPPSFQEVTTQMRNQFIKKPAKGGWRLEDYIVDELLACKSGLVDDSPTYEHLMHIFSQKQAPIHAALVITLDMATVAG